MTEIEVKNLCKTINKNMVLDNINLHMVSGQVYGFQGINGSGKTMLMRALIGLIHPTSGTILIDQKELGKDMDFPKSIGFLLENPTFLDMYSGPDNLRLLAGVDNNISADMINKEIDSLIEEVGLKVPNFNSIGIHGTCKPESIGTRDSEGCIRLHNNDLQRLRALIYLGMPVIINKDE